MKSNIDFYDLALYCVEEYKNGLDKERSKYIDTTFVSIDIDNNLKKSKTPHILRNAEKVLLIHKKTERACTNWYYWYEVKFIDSDGCVHVNSIDDDFELSIIASGNFASQYIRLETAKTRLYSEPYDDSLIDKIWSLYLKCKECKTLNEMKLVSRLASQDENILSLKKELDSQNYSTMLIEKERDLYKSLLDDINQMLKK